MGLSLVTPPATDPVSLEEARLHLRVIATEENALITSLIKAATALAQNLTARQFVTATYRLTLDRFSRRIVLPRPPLISVTEVAYVDAAGDEQTVDAADYHVIVDGVFGVLVFRDAVAPPTVGRQPNAVAIEFEAGFGAAAAVPDEIKAAIKLLVGHLYENREQVLVGPAPHQTPMAAVDLLAMWAVPSLGYDPNAAREVA